jgi:hypothetical protein
MTRYRAILSDLVFSLLVLLLVLAAFRERIQAPAWLSGMGRTHPLLVHFPIAFLLLILVLYPFRSRFSSKPGLDEVYGMLLLHAAGFAILSACAGLLLSLEGGYDDKILTRHLWTGVVTSASAYLAWSIGTRPGAWRHAVTVLMAICGISLVWGSHNGGILTHGEDYLTWIPENKSLPERTPVTDSTAVYEAAIRPILEAKCYGCHNESKAKGKLIMTSAALLLKGGSEGPLWVSGDPDKSLMMHRLLLDMADKKHMPPRGKPQLTAEEIALLHDWIARGGDLQKAFRDYPATDSFRIFAAGFSTAPAASATAGRTFDFPSADQGLITKLNNPYRVIKPLDHQSPALDLDFFIGSQYKPASLEECLPLKEQLVSVNLANMPAGDEALTQIIRFTNLEELFLNGTRISGSTLGSLTSNRKLKRLSLANTSVKAKQVEALGKHPSLKKVYLWKTAITAEEMEGLRKKFPGIAWDNGYVPDSTEYLKLTRPQMKNPEKMVFGKGDSLILKHPMPGVTIRFTTDGKEPDSLSGTAFKIPIPIGGPTQIRAMAVMPGWFASDIAEFQVFSGGIRPASAQLLSEPDPRYRVQGGNSLFDGNKGESNNTLVNWLGFRENPFIAVFRFEGSPSLSRVILSMADNNGAYIMPPARVIVMAGNDSSKLSPAGRLSPVQPLKYGPVRNQTYIVDIKPGNYRYVRVQADPVSSLPAWHRGKGDKGWVFVDEVFFD